MSRGSNGRPRCRNTSTSFPTTRRKITAQRPANIRTIERYLLLAADLPGLKFKNSLKPHPSKQGAAILVVEVTEKPADVFARVDNRGTKARGPGQFLISPTVNNLLRIHDAFTLTYAGAFQTRELQYLAANLPAGADQRGPHRLRQRQLRLGPSRHVRAGAAGVQDQERRTSRPA